MLTLSAQATIWVYSNKTNASVEHRTNPISLQVTITNGTISSVTFNSNQTASGPYNGDAQGVITPYTVTDYSWSDEN